MSDFEKMLEYIVQNNASDLHLSTGVPPTARINGKLKHIADKPLPASFIEKSMQEIMTSEQYDNYIKDWQLDFSAEFPNISRFRVNAFRQSRGPAAVFRVIKSKAPTLDEMNLPPILKELVMGERGLILVTGPTGSGKSTTLAAMIDYINSNKSGHILTVEDPIEFVHPNKNCLINQREVGSNVRSFAQAIKAALREDPDIILVGEMRDLETISLAITAAETGHLVLATLHTNTAPKAVDRIINVFPGEQQMQIRSMLSESLRAVIAQELLPRLDEKGRVASMEILIGTHAVRNIIRENKLFQLPTIMQTATSVGMQTMEQHLNALVMKGKIAKDIAMDKVKSLR